MVYKKSATVLTIGVSLLFLVRLRSEGELHGSGGFIFCAWFVSAAIAQTLAPGLGVWLLGELAQLMLVMVLFVKQRLSDIT